MDYPEILAPVGGAEQLIAAVRSGADAVYLGADAFNARRNADNFGDRDLPEAVRYCHERSVKVYVAVNILITDREIADLLALAKKLSAANVDAVIVQDLAVAHIFRVSCPELPLHASTQMTIHNKAGVRAAEHYGFVRFVPARELSLPEIAHMAACTAIETEAFVHGALCMSVSGCCYLSSLLGGRSGNRGLCAQACRLNFKAGDRQYALSLKDMSYIDHIADLQKAGVCSLKIEGRMKRPEYVAAAVCACLHAREGKPYDKELLKNVFSRSGFTDGYLTGKRDRSMFGHRTKEDVLCASGDVFAGLHSLYRTERQTVPIRAELTVGSERTELKLSDGTNAVSQCGEGGVQPQKAPLSMAYAEKNVGKTGGTPYYLEQFDLSNPEELFLSAAQINELRRGALDRLSEKRVHRQSRIFREFDERLPEKEHRFRSFYMRFAKTEQIFAGDFEKIFLPIDEILKEPSVAEAYAGRLVAETPALVFESEEAAFCRKLEKLIRLGIGCASADNIGQLALLKEYGFEVVGGFGLNILNSVALQEYKKLGIAEAILSFELAADQLRRLKTDMDLTVLAYGYLPLMKYRNCPIKQEHGCADCKGSGMLTDRKMIDFPVICANKSFSVLYNSVPLDVCDRDFSFADHKLLYFTTETKQACMHVLDCARKGICAADKHTTGLYFRELL